jgi:hypothetical protein
MRMRLGLVLVALSLLSGLVDRSDAGWGRRRQCCPRPCSPCYPVVTLAPEPVHRPARVRTFLEGDVAEDDLENAGKGVRREAILRFNTRIPEEDQINAKHRVFPKTSVVHNGESQTFDDTDELINYFESPLRKQEQWWRKAIKMTTEERNSEIELVNVTVRDAWIYEISHQGDNDYHLLIGTRPDNDGAGGRYLNAEISAINTDSPDASDLWELRKGFKAEYQSYAGRPLPKGFTQPTKPIHIRVTGSIFLDADHDRGEVGHGDITNFTSWEIHPITSIHIVNDRADLGVICPEGPWPGNSQSLGWAIRQ